MSAFGQFALTFSWIVSLFACISGIFAGRSGKDSWFFTVRNATIFVTLGTFLALASLAYCFLNNDYAVQYVWQYSNRAMPSMYKVSAIWGGMDGSMLLWAGILSLFGATLAFYAARYNRKLLGWTLAVFNSSTFFFLTVVLFYTNPFRYLKQEFIPLDGNGLNPLLQNPYMAIHPPCLYAGFTSMAIPYAFCMGALLAGELHNEWIRLTRRWILIGWMFLTIGIFLGGHWAYLELGWGGFWAWDPVENASFLPWLTATAFLHSVMVQERKDMLKFWNVWLVVLTYALTVFGTFLTRSGIVQSVHAFASTDVGEVFLQYLAILLIVAGVLTWYRRKELRSTRHIESLISREAAFLFNNLALLSICFATLWGVMFPILSEAITGKKQTVGIPFFNAVNVPLFLILLFLMGVGPLIAWRKASLSSIRQIFLKPFLSGFVIALILLWGGVTSFYALLAYGLSVFIVGTIFGELHRGYRTVSTTANPIAATTKLLKRHRTRYGGYFVHFGVVIAAIGITASMAHKVEKEFSLTLNESTEIGRFRFTLQSLTPGRNDNYESLIAEVALKNNADDTLLTVMHPEKRFYFTNKETTSEVALRMSAREDVYLVLAGIGDDGKSAYFKVFLNPLQLWLWVGGLIIVVGTIIILLPASERARKTEQAELAKETVHI
jgi:cytochrome c-type biogenesis protein CcmF